MRYVPIAPGTTAIARRTQRRTRQTWSWSRRFVGLPLAALVIAVAPAAQVRAASPDSVLVWNQYAVEALANPTTAATPGAGQPPPVAVIHLAMVQTAVYDAVNAIEGGYTPFAYGGQAAGASIEAAVATAAYDVLTGLDPAPPLPAGVLTRLTNLRDAFLAAIPDSAAKTAGIATGAASADALLAKRAGDHRYENATLRFTVGFGPGEWRPGPSGNDPFFWVAFVKPFTLNSTSQLRTEGPLDMTSDQYTKEFNEVKSVGALNSTTRTAEQTAMARFYTESPVLLYNRSFRTIAADQDLDAAGVARLFAQMNMAASDAIISCWDDKEYWGVWRPSTAIQLADTDGNPDTIADPTWAPLVGNPPYPDHPSGYNCFTAAIAHSAKAFFGTDKADFAIVNAAGVEREYSRFTDVVRDTIDGRIYLGIHFRTPDVQGAWIGKKAAQWVDRHAFQPVH